MTGSLEWGTGYMNWSVSEKIAQTTSVDSKAEFIMNQKHGTVLRYYVHSTVDDKDSLVVIRAIANCKHMSDFDKMCLIRGYCQCINTVKDVKEELETTALYSRK